MTTNYQQVQCFVKKLIFKKTIIIIIQQKNFKVNHNCLKQLILSLLSDYLTD